VYMVLHVNIECFELKEYACGSIDTCVPKLRSPTTELNFRCLKPALLIFFLNRKL
jgi:hypothetical protein